MRNFDMTVRDVAKWVSTTEGYVRQAYHSGQLSGEIIDGVLIFKFSEVAPWEARLKSQDQNIPREKPKTIKGGKAEKRIEISEEELKKSFDPGLYDHQISGHNKYEKHSERSFKEHYDDSDGSRYD